MDYKSQQLHQNHYANLNCIEGKQHRKIIKKKKIIDEPATAPLQIVYSEPDIAYAVGVLSQHTNKPQQRHWNGIYSTFCVILKAQLHEV